MRRCEPYNKKQKLSRQRKARQFEKNLVTATAPFAKVGCAWKTWLILYFCVRWEPEMRVRIAERVVNAICNICKVRNVCNVYSVCIL